MARIAVGSWWHSRFPNFFLLSYTDFRLFMQLFYLQMFLSH